MSFYYNDYEKKFPNIVIEILEYFDVSNQNPNKPIDKRIIKFCEQHKQGNDLIYQPQTISKICKRLCECGQILPSRAISNLLKLLSLEPSLLKSL